MNIFERKTVRPVLLEIGEPFDSEDYFFELKFDGIRAIAFLEKSCPTRTQKKDSESNHALNEKDGADSLNCGQTFMINRKNRDISETVYPELRNLHVQVKANCVLDGEIIAVTDGKPDFFKLQSRALSSSPLRTAHAAKTDPVQFVAFDILHYDGRDVVDLPLAERKKLLSKVVQDSDRMLVSKYIENQGKALFELARGERLEGIIAKRKTSLYKEGARSSDWIKIKVRHDVDFQLLGYKFDSEAGKIVSLLFGDGEWHNFNLSKMDSDAIIKYAEPYVVKSTGGITELEPRLTCIVSYNEKTNSGSLRGAVYKGIRID